MPDPTELLTSSEAADFLFVSESTLRSMRAKGCGPRFIKVGGRFVRYRLSDLHAYTASLRTCDQARLANRRQRVEREKGRPHAH